MKIMIRLAAIITVFAASIFVADTTLAASSFNSLTVDQSSIMANGSDIQTARLVINVSDPNLLDYAALVTNRQRGIQDHNNLRGLFRWTPATGFQKYGTVQYWNNDTVNLITTGPNASERIIDTAAGTVTFIFRYTANSNYGNVPDNDLSYQFGESSSNFYSSIPEVDTSYSVVGTVNPTFTSLTVDKQNVIANGQDVQTATVVINNADQNNLDYIAIMANRQRGIQDHNNLRGLFRYTDATGFTEHGTTSYFNNDTVNLITTGPDASFIQRSGGVTTVVFKWTADPSYGDVPDNDLSYQLGDTRRNWYSNIVEIDTSYSVNQLVIVPTSLEVTTLDTPGPITVAAGITDLVLARVELDATGSGEDLRVTQFKVRNYLNNSRGRGIDVQNIRLYVDTDGDSFNATQNIVALSEVENGSNPNFGVDETITFNLSGTDQFLVKADKKLIVEIRGDLAANSLYRARYQFATNQDNYVTAHGVSASTVSEVVNSNFGTRVINVGLSGASLQVSRDSGAQVARLYPGGATGVTLGSFNFLATTTEDVVLDGLLLTMNERNTRLSSFQDYNLLYLEDESGNLVASVVPTSTTPFITFPTNSYVVDKDDTDGQVLYLKANLASIGRPGSGAPINIGGHRLGFRMPFVRGNVFAHGALTHARTTAFAPTGYAVELDTHIAYKAIPTVTKLFGSSNLANGTNDLFRFRVAADGGSIDLHKFTFDVNFLGVNISNLELYDVTHANEVLLDSLATLPSTGFFETYVDANQDGVTDQVEVQANQPRTFVLRATVTGVNSGDHIATRLGGDAGAYDKGTTIMGSASDVDRYVPHNDFIWSDRHTVDPITGIHDVNNFDWTNGYLVTGLNSASSTPTILSL